MGAEAAVHQLWRLGAALIREGLMMWGLRNVDDNIRSFNIRSSSDKRVPNQSAIQLEAL